MPKKTPKKDSKVVKTAGGPRKIRCRKCWNIAVYNQNENYYKCLGCGSPILSKTI